MSDLKLTLIRFENFDLLYRRVGAAEANKNYAAPQH
jgi:hypothetical protein